MTRPIAFLIAAFALYAPANADPLIVQDGDYYPVLAHGDALIAGGRVDTMNVFGDSIEITGGSVGDPGAVFANLYHGTLAISGGSVAGFAHSHGSTLTFSIAADYLRVADYGQEESNSWTIEGFLPDGSFIDVTLTHDLATSRARVSFTATGANPPAGDTDSDWDVDISDLNEIRNNFGSPYTIDDLNAARNNFGYGSQFTLAPEFAITMNPVPEPHAAGLAIVFVSFAGFAYLIATARE